MFVRFPFLIALLCATAANGFCADPSLSEIDKIFATYAGEKTPGCAIAVGRNGAVILKRAWGQASLEHNVPLSAASRFHAGSVSKQITAAAIALLVKDGKLSLDDPIRKYLPELSQAHDSITIRHLLEHTSGLRDQWTLLTLAGWRLPYDVVTDDDVLSIAFRQQQLNFPPGLHFEYSNTGYTLLAQIVKRVAGVPLSQFARRRIFEPIGMRATQFLDEQARVVESLAGAYIRDGARGFRLQPANYSTTGATGLVTTAEDLLLWLMNLSEPKIGDQRFISGILPERPQADDEYTYRFGLVGGVYRGLRTIGHTGAVAGYRAGDLYFPDNRFAIACLCNTDANVSLLERRVTDLYLADILKEPTQERHPPAAIDVAPDLLRGRAGLYRDVQTNGVRRIVFEANLLKYELDESSYSLVPVGQERFYLKAPGPFTEIEFTDERHMTVRAKGEAPVIFELTQPARAPGLGEFAGLYFARELGTTYRIAYDGTVLRAMRPKDRPRIMTPTFEDGFESPIGSVAFTRDSNGRINGFLLSMSKVHSLRFVRQAESN